MKRLFLLLALVALAVPHLSAMPPGMEVADFRGGSDVLLETPEHRITEAELFRYAVMTNLVPPETVTEWRELEPTARLQVREALLALMRGKILAEAWIEREREDVFEAELSDKGARILAYPVANLLWADTYVRDNIHIFPEDYAFFYKQNQDLFGDPGTVRVRRLRVPFPATVTLEARERVRREAEELRERAVQEGGLEPLLRERPELLVDPPGRTYEIQRGTTAVDRFVKSEAFRLGIAQISEPIPTQLGYLLIEVVDRQETSVLPLAEVMDQIEEELYQVFLPQQFEYLAIKTVERARPMARGHLYQFMPEDANIMQVRRFGVTREEFRRLYPEFIGDEEDPNQDIIIATVGGMVLGEAVTQHLEREGLAGDSLYREAIPEARTLHRAGQYVRRIRQELEPDSEEVWAYLEENRETIIPGAEKTVWRFGMNVRRPAELAPGEREGLRLLMTGYVEEMTRQAQRLITERARVSPATAFAEPGQVIRQIPAPEDRRLRTSFENIGAFDEQRARRELAVPHEELRLGEFTRPVTLRDGTVVSYFVSEETIPPLPEDEEELYELARFSLVVKLSEAKARDLIDAWEEAGELRFAEELEVPAGTEQVEPSPGIPLVP